GQRHPVSLAVRGIADNVDLRMAGYLQCRLDRDTSLSSSGESQSVVEAGGARSGRPDHRIRGNDLAALEPDADTIVVGDGGAESHFDVLAPERLSRRLPQPLRHGREEPVCRLE